MYAGIHGAQRSGKTYFCVRTCIDFIRHTDRDIFTNLPLNPDYMARFAVGRKFQNLDKYYEVFRRIHLFMDFPTFKSAKDWARKNRDFWRFCRFDRNYKRTFFKDYLAEYGHYPSKEDWPLDYYEAGYIWPTRWIFDFWRLTKRKRTVFMFDEFYEYFSSLDYSSTGKDVRKQLLSFTRQHGHDNHHVYLISHDPDDLDRIIRQGFMYQYFVKNSKYVNLFQNKWLRGFRSPVQYFIVYAYASGDAEPQESYPVLPDKAIFKCYNSNSLASTLREVNSGECKADVYDDNRGHNFWHNFKQYFVRQGWVTFAVLSSVFLGCYFLYQGYKSVLPGKAKTDVKINQPLKSLEQGRGALSEDLQVVGVFGDKVIWSDNFNLKVGDSYYGLKVKEINCRKETVVFAAPNGKLYSIPFAGCRVAQQQQSTAKAADKSKIKK
ncbi:MAG: hypothetical protein PHH77_02320 [Victivallaceae bacterium]|nr:hypothetical protein [Victivallaceae bacterium]MDD5697427.1 hypothetical protein [Victivallaceae bacterium]